MLPLVLIGCARTMPLRLSLRGLLLFVTAAAIACWLLIVQPWREERFRPYSEYQHEENSKQLRRELLAGQGQPPTGLYVKTSGKRWLCLAIGATRWNFEAGPTDFTYSYGTLDRRGDFIHLKEHWNARMCQIE